MSFRCAPLFLLFLLSCMSAGNRQAEQPGSDLYGGKVFGIYQPLEVQETEELITVSGETFSYSIDRSTGQIVSARVLGDEFIATGGSFPNPYVGLMPENYALSVAYIEALIDAQKYDKAREVAARSVSLRNNDPRLYRLVGRIEKLAGNPAESHRMLAEAYVAEGRLQPAIQQLDIALREAGKEDFQQLSRLESRLNHLREALKREKEEDKP